MDTIQSLLLNFLNLFDDFDGLVGAILLLSGARTVLDSRIHDFLFEISWDGIISNASAHQRHHNRASYLGISAFLKHMDQTFNKIVSRTTDFDAGISEGCFKFAQIPPTGNLNSLFNHLPQLQQFGTSIIVYPFRSMIESVTNILLHK